jgi:hypothetical protein
VPGWWKWHPGAFARPALADALAHLEVADEALAAGRLHHFFPVHRAASIFWRIPSARSRAVRSWCSTRAPGGRSCAVTSIQVLAVGGETCLEIVVAEVVKASPVDRLLPQPSDGGVCCHATRRHLLLIQTRRYAQTLGPATAGYGRKRPIAVRQETGSYEVEADLTGIA